MRGVGLAVLGIIVVVIGVLAASALFTVHQTQQGIVLQFGNPKQVIKEPGLHFKLPFIQNVEYLEARVLDFAPRAEEIITSDQKRVVMDSFLRYRISDPLKFYQTVGSEFGAQSRLDGVVISSLRLVVGSSNFSSILSEERENIMRTIRGEVNQQAQAFGIEIVDFRIRRTDLPDANAQSIYQRMQTEREREAKEFRAQGEEVSQRIRARADRERTVLLAESQKKSQILRGEGDALAIKIYADSFGQDPEFFAFYRSMEAYRKALGQDGTTMVLSPDSDFFSFFGDITGKPREAGGQR